MNRKINDLVRSQLQPEIHYYALRENVKRKRRLLNAGFQLNPGFGSAAPGRHPESMREVRVDPKHLAIYAEQYLSGHPEERNPTVLVKALVGPAGDERDDNVRELLRERIRMDFDVGRTVNLDGWILSVSEVRLWCLIHLLSG